MINPIETYDVHSAALSSVNNSQKLLSDLDSSIFELLNGGANAHHLKGWLIDAVELFDAAIGDG